MKHWSCLIACVLALLLLLCGCKPSRAVANEVEAAERLNLFLQDFAYSEKDTYDCVLQEVVTEEGEPVYRMEAFWQTEAGERFSLGLFRVAADGSVTAERDTAVK